MSDTIRSLTGPAGPFPRSALSDPIERRWLHYAFMTRDSAQSLVANISWLGGEGGAPPRKMAILLLHDIDSGWSATEWNARCADVPWSAFRLPSPAGDPDERDFVMTAAKEWPAASLNLRRTSTPCASQCATFHGDHWMRWQSEPGVLADGWLRGGPGEPRAADAVGYHERVRGRWGWPEMGGWVFGFCNDIGGDLDAAPPWAVVFTLLQPDRDGRGQAASVMVWRRGRLVRHFPRRSLRVSVAGQLDRDRVQTVPFLSSLLGVPPTVPIPAALCIDGYQGADRVRLRFYARTAGRIVIPSETSLSPFSVHEVVGGMEVDLVLGGDAHSFRSPGIVEFAGGASLDAPL